jgi:hypothetical protein
MSEIAKQEALDSRWWLLMQAQLKHAFNSSKHMHEMIGQGCHLSYHMPMHPPKYRWDASSQLVIREEKLLHLVLWKMVHFALFFLEKISINFSPSYSTVFFPSQCMSLLYKNFKTLVQCFNE